MQDRAGPGSLGLGLAFETLYVSAVSWFGIPYDETVKPTKYRSLSQQLIYVITLQALGIAMAFNTGLSGYFRFQGNTFSNSVY